jgi:hypothetical protein
LFGLITLLEMNLRESIRQYYRNDEWVNMLGKERLAKVKDLQKLRITRDTSIGLLECTQLCDLKEIIARGPLFQKIFASLSLKVEDFRSSLKRIEYCRNDLAHAQALDIDSLLSIFKETKQCLESSEAWLHKRMNY